MKKNFVLIFIFLGMAQAILPDSLLAQTPVPFDELGAGPKATAMGQAFTAIADDASAAYYNPAGLTQIKSPGHITVGYQYAKPKIHVHFDVEPVRNPALAPLEFNDFSTNALYVGYACNFAEVRAFQDNPVSKRLAFGVSIFTNIPEINEFQNPQRPQDPYVFKYNERWCLISLAISFACKCTEWLSVGGGILPRVDTFQESRGSWIDVTRAIDPNDPSRGFRMNLSVKTNINVVPIGGILLKPPFRFLKGKVSIGVSYRDKMWGFYGTGMTAVDVLVDRPGHEPIVIRSDPGGRTVDYVGFTPEQVTAAIAAKPFQGLTVAFDMTWKKYSSFHFFWDMPPYDVRVIDGVKEDKPFDDVWVPRVGLAYAFDPGLKGRYLKKITEISLLTGYYREPSPVPDMNGPMNILDADQNVVSAGFGITYDADWTKYVKLEAFFQAHLLEDNYIPNDRDPLYSGITVGGQVWAFGLALSIDY